jgi:hypothetical protein
MKIDDLRKPAAEGAAQTAEVKTRAAFIAEILSG